MPNKTELSLDRIIYQPAQQALARVILAHGAGAGNRHEFMDRFATKLAEQGFEVHSINFPYMQTAYEQDKKRPPNSNKQLISYFRDLVNADDASLPLFIAGKSMGGRVATQIMVEHDVSKKVLAAFVLGYPFVPPGKPDKLPERIKHFTQISRPVLILQGERDTFGGKELVSKQSLPTSFSVGWVTSGDHSFKPLKASGLSSEINIDSAAVEAAEFMRRELSNVQ